MSSTGPAPAELQRLLDRMNAGDRPARDELIAFACDRLRGWAHKVLKIYPHVRRWEDTGDVLQNAVLRLMQALHQVNPPTVEDFLRLAANKIRCEVVDLARHYYGPEGLAAHHDSNVPPGSSGRPTPDASEDTWEPARLAQWCEAQERLRQAIDQLTESERTTFELRYFLDYTVADTASGLGVSEEVVRQRWHRALLKLQPLLKDAWPGA